VIGEESIEQMPKYAGKQPTTWWLRGCGFPDAMGIFPSLTFHEGVKSVGVEAAGHGIESGNARSLWHAAGGLCCMAIAPTFFFFFFPKFFSKKKKNRGPGSNGGKPKGFFFGKRERNLHSSVAGLDYPGRGARACLVERPNGRAYVGHTNDDEALSLPYCCQNTKVSFQALETAHAFGRGRADGATLPKIRSSW